MTNREENAKNLINWYILLREPKTTFKEENILLEAEAYQIE